MEGGEVESTIMKCPTCGNEMEEGFLSFNRPFSIEWVTGKERPRTEETGAIKMLIYEPGYWWKYIKAYRCKSCDLALFKYGKDARTVLDMIHSRKDKN
jgi:hypothetical protein